MKKRWENLFRFLILTGACTMLCAGCQKTPEKAVVVTKIGGLPDGAAIEELNTGETREPGIPKEWKETVKKGEGKAVILVDLKPQISNIGNTPVWEMESKSFENNELEKLCDYFSKKSKLYLKPRMTTAELSEIKSRIKNKEGDFGSPWSLSTNGTYLKNIEELLKDAPKETQTNPVYVQPEFTTYSLPERLHILRGGEITENTTEKNRFSAIIEDDSQPNGEIEAISYNKAAGTSSNFKYQKGMVFSVSDMADMRAQNINTVGLKGESNFTKAEEELIDKVEAAMEQGQLTQEEAEVTANQILEDLNITEMKNTDVSKAICFKESAKISTYQEIWNADVSKATTGYQFTYYRAINDIASFIGHSWYYEGPDLTYTPSFYPEKIVITVTEEGVVQFLWETMAKKTKTISKNTKLLDFSEIKEKLYNHLYYTVASDSGTTYEIHISGVDFRYGYSTAYENPEHVWMIPMWVFSIDKVMDAGGQIVQDVPEQICLNAIDGGYITFQATSLSGF